MTTKEGREPVFRRGGDPGGPPPRVRRGRLLRVLPVPALLLGMAGLWSTPAVASSCSPTSLPDISAPNSPSSGAMTGGTTVAVTGDNFTKVAGVSFGSVPASSFTVLTCNQISAVSPPGVGTVHVQVTNSVGASPTSAIDQFSYTLLGAPKPTVTGVSPASGSASGGTTVTVNGSGFNQLLGGSPSVSFGTTSATGVVVQSDSQLTVPSPSQSGAGIVDVTVTTQGGTSAISPADRYTYYPTVTAVSPSTGGTNGGTSVTIAGSGFANASSVNFGGYGAAFTVNSSSQITATSPVHAGAGAVDVQVVAGGQGSPSGVQDQFTYQQGYCIANLSGTVVCQGGAQSYGSLNQPLNQPISGIAETSDGRGYWLVAKDGGLFPFGDAAGRGSIPGTPGMVLHGSIVGIAGTPDNQGYWMVSDQGAIYAFGDANPNLGQWYPNSLAKPVSGLVSTPDGGGYWMVARDGGIFPFGNACGCGSMGGKPLNADMVGMTRTPDGRGYWLVGADGGVFSFGDTPPGCCGSGSGIVPLGIVGIAATPDGRGYWMVESSGATYSFGDAATLPGSGGAVGIAALP